VFDLRYHVASLTAVFLALVIGILVGVGMSGRGFVTDAERDNFNDRLAALDEQLQEEELVVEDLELRQESAQEFVESAYPVLVEGRLEGQNVAVLVIGSYDDTLNDVREVVRRADGALVRVRAVTVPIPTEEIQSALRSDAEPGEFVGEEELDDLGRELHLPPGGGAVAGALRRGSRDGLDDRRMRVAEDQRTPGADPVDVVVAVDVGDREAGGALDEDRVAPDRVHRPDG